MSGASGSTNRTMQSTDIRPEILQELAEVGVSEIHARLDRGFPSSALPRFAAVLREALGSNDLLNEYIDRIPGNLIATPTMTRTTD